MLKEQEFRNDLPSVTVCDKCGAYITLLSWTVSKFGPAEWSAIGIAKCEPCSWVKVAAAGSDELAHEYARHIRLKFVKSLNS